MIAQERPDQQWLNPRGITERVRITGTLVLDTPAHFGNGDSDGLTDIALSRDPLEGLPLLTGASIAGALRNYLREVQLGFGVGEARTGATLAEKLFGHLFQDDKTNSKASVHSWLTVDDALGRNARFEFRDGVAIDARTHTAEEGLKFDLELLAAGTSFDLVFELALPADPALSQDLLPALCTALRGLGESHAMPGAIQLGTRKRRGFGLCHVERWRHQRYSMGEPQEFLDWLTEGPGRALDGLPAEAWIGEVRRHELLINAAFAIDGSVLIRSDSGKEGSADVAHLRSHRGGDEVPVISGTSLAGVIRSRGLRIANTVLGAAGPAFVDAMFGARLLRDSETKHKPTGSHVTVSEAAIDGGVTDRVQNRLKIDRFTGGAYPGALFSEQPVWSQSGRNEARITLKVGLRQPAHGRPQDFDARAGLLLLVVKDLWTGDLPVGGESSVGRGRLRGLSATLRLGADSWTLAGDDALTLSAPDKQALMEDWVAAFNSWSPATPVKEG